MFLTLLLKNVRRAKISMGAQNATKKNAWNAMMDRSLRKGNASLNDYDLFYFYAPTISFIQIYLFIRAFIMANILILG